MENEMEKICVFERKNVFSEKKAPFHFAIFRFCCIFAEQLENNSEIK